MKLRSVTISGLKGCPGQTFELSPLTMISGANGSGKSRIRDAILLLALGYHPTAARGGTAAKKEADVMRLASGDVLEVGGVVELPDGTTRRLSRVWTRAKKGGKISFPKSTATVDGPAGRLTGKEAEIEIGRFLGSPLSLDLATVAGADATDTERRDLLFRFVSAGGLDEGALLELLEAEGVKLETLRSVWSVAPSLLDAPPSSWTLAPWRPELGSVALWLSDEAAMLSDLAKTAKRKLDALRGSLSLEGGEQIEPREVERLGLAHEEARAEVRRVAEACDELVRSADEAVTKERKRLEDLRILAEAFERAKAKLEALEAARPEEEIEAIEAEILDLEEKRGRKATERDGLEAELSAASGAVFSTTEAARKADDQAKEASDELRRISDGLAAKKVAAAEALAGPRAELREEERRAASLRSLLEAGAECCPSCLRPVRAGGAVEEELIRLLGALDGAVVVQRERIQVEEEIQGRTIGAWAAREKRQRTEADELHPIALAAKTAVRTATLAREEVGRRLSVARSSFDELGSSLEGLRTRLSVLRAGAELEAKIGAAKAEVERISEQRKSLSAFVSLGGLQQAAIEARERKGDQVGAAEARAKAAGEEQVAAHRKLERRQQTAKIEDQVTRAETAWRQAKDLAEALGPKGAQGRLLRTGLGPFLDVVNRALDGLDLGRFGIRWTDDQGKEICAFGLEADGGPWRPVETLSGGEVVTVGAAILAGLSSLSGAPWRALLVDEIETLDRTRRDVFGRAVRSLLDDKVIDQAILFGCPDQVPELDGATSILL